MTTFQLREAIQDDLDALVSLEISSFPGDRISRRSWRDLLKSASALVTVASDGSRVIGSTVTLFNRRAAMARLYSIAVVPEARRQGVAQMLLDGAITSAVQAGACMLRLETRFDNVPAQKLFIRLGFKPFKRVPSYYEDGAEAIRYQRTISSDEIDTHP